MSAAASGPQQDQAADGQPSDPPLTGNALVAAYDGRLVALVREALQRVAPRMVPGVLDGSTGLGALLLSLRPVLTLVDLNLIEHSARELVAQARAANAEARVVVIAGHGDDDRVLPALRAGASGFVVKHDTLPELCAQLQTVLAGALPVTPGLARQLLRQLDWSGLARELSSVEIEVLTWISLGETPAEVAGRMQIGADALRQRLEHVFEVLQLPGAAAVDL